MKHYRYLLFAALLLLSACIPRNNPLDPAGNSDIIAPEVVSSVQCFASSAGAANKYVNVVWTPNSDLTTQGYFVYRSLAYNSSYVRVGRVETNTGSFMHNTDIRPGLYWYKVSGYKDWVDDGTDEGILEGRLSSARDVYVN